MARTRGAKSSSPSSRKQSLRKEPIPGPVSKPSQPRAVPPPVKPAPPKPPARRYLTRSRGRPLQKRPRVESSEPIDLTEQSPKTFAGSNSSSLTDSLTNSASGAISDAASRTTGASAATSRAPNSI
ncbi:hypothetical protein VitviT2T_006932 [Vitis vinifera]|uniref:Uncharacterized protein n=1 Tax=Vitis vinifera TaxID=29760 RepID=A0ABY9BXY9_VITVI|nr:hypothetical protein VitviT2T_006932 [Vitis vinifera]